MNAGPGLGMGMGWGRRGGGRGRRNMYYATGIPGWARFGYAGPGAVPPLYGPPAPEQEMDGLKAQANMLQQQLEMINKRIADLEEK